MRRRVEFFVPGIPVQQGSKRPIRTGAAGGYKGGLRVMDVNAKKLKPWRALVHDAAVEAVNGAEPMNGPVSAVVTFYFPRPKKHAKMKRPPVYVDKQPDLDKLERAVYDSLSGVVYDDDKRVVWHNNLKRFAEGDLEPGVRVVIQELHER